VKIYSIANRLVEKYGMGNLKSCTLIQKGISTNVFGIETSKGMWVLKTNVDNKINPKRFQKEKKVYSFLEQRSFVSVPSDYVVDKSRSIFLSPVALMKRVPGKNCLLLWEEFDKDSKKKLLFEMGKLLSRFHAVSVGQNLSQFFELKKNCDVGPISYKERLKENLSSLIGSSNFQGKKKKKLLELGFDLINKVIFPKPNDLVLLHGDYHLENVVLNTLDKDWELFLLDFEYYSIGFPEKDLLGMEMFFLIQDKDFRVSFFEGYGLAGGCDCVSYKKKLTVFQIIYSLTMLSLYKENSLTHSFIERHRSYLDKIITGRMYIDE
jgi:aminoglycoside phosphotransferase (APT) family kinase protein